MPSKQISMACSFDVALLIHGQPSNGKTGGGGCDGDGTAGKGGGELGGCSVQHPSHAPPQPSVAVTSWTSWHERGRKTSHCSPVFIWVPLQIRVHSDGSGGGAGGNGATVAAVVGPTTHTEAAERTWRGPECMQVTRIAIAENHNAQPRAPGVSKPVHPHLEDTCWHRPARIERKARNIPGRHLRVVRRGRMLQGVDELEQLLPVKHMDQPVAAAVRAVTAGKRRARRRRVHAPEMLMGVKSGPSHVRRPPSSAVSQLTSQQ